MEILFFVIAFTLSIVAFAYYTYQEEKEKRIYLYNLRKEATAMTDDILASYYQGAKAYIEMESKNQ